MNRTVGVSALGAACAATAVFAALVAVIPMAAFALLPLIGIAVLCRSPRIRRAAWQALPAAWVFLSLYYASLGHVANTFLVVSLGVAAVGALSGQVHRPMIALAVIVVVVSMAFTHGDAFFSTAWVAAALAAAFLRAPLAAPDSPVRMARLLLRGGAIVALVGGVDQYALHSRIFQLVQDARHVEITYNGAVDRYSGLFGQPNQAGMYFVVLLALGLGQLALRQMTRIDLISLGTVAGALAATLSRASLLAVVAVVASLAFRRRISGVSRIKTFAGLSVALVGATLVPAFSTFLETLLSDNYQSNIARRLIYSGAAKAIAAHPLTGYGFGEVARVLPRYVPVGVHGIPDPLEDAHNVLLTLALWAGLPFAVLVVAALIYGASKLVQGGPRLPWTAACLAILVNCMLDSPLTSLAHLPLYMLVVIMALLTPTTGTDTATAVHSVDELEPHFVNPFQPKGPPLSASSLCPPGGPRPAVTINSAV